MWRLSSDFFGWKRHTRLQVLRSFHESCLYHFQDRIHSLQHWQHSTTQVYVGALPFLRTKNWLRSVAAVCTTKNTAVSLQRPSNVSIVWGCFSCATFLLIFNRITLEAVDWESGRSMISQVCEFWNSFLFQFMSPALFCSSFLLHQTLHFLGAPCNWLANRFPPNLIICALPLIANHQLNPTDRHEWPLDHLIVYTGSSRVFSFSVWLADKLLRLLISRIAWYIFVDHHLHSAFVSPDIWYRTVIAKHAFLKFILCCAFSSTAEAVSIVWDKASCFSVCLSGFFAFLSCRSNCQSISSLLPLCLLDYLWLIFSSQFLVNLFN